MLVLGIDLGTSSVKVSVVDAATQHCLAAAQYPEVEADIMALQPGWAEQKPEVWWLYVTQAIARCHASSAYNPKDIQAIGIAYQMHGLVVVDKDQRVLRPSIIWCDGRAVSQGEAAALELGEEFCLTHLLNTPGNFTASKLAWVKEHEAAVYSKVNKAMLPGDFIALTLTGECTTTASALSEGIFWDFKQHELSAEVMTCFGFDNTIIPTIRPLFGEHGRLTEVAAGQLGLSAGIPVTYKAGDQLNNAFSLGVLHPGEVAATAGTSGVIYGVSDDLFYDPQSRINSFAHVNHTKEDYRVGVLLCINGAGIFNRWIRNMAGAQHSYAALNEAAAKVPAGSQGLVMLPFGNGAERILNNRNIGAHIHHLDFNLHATPHLVRAAQEGIAFAFRYGLDIMRENGMNPSVVRAGRANMFLSPVFLEAFVNVTGVPVEMYETDGSIGAALGAAVGAGYFTGPAEAFGNRKPLARHAPDGSTTYNDLYPAWKQALGKQILKPGVSSIQPA